MSYTWELGRDPEEMHALLCACDAYTATSAAPPPMRRFETTRRRVAAGAVHVLRCGTEAVATFSLTWEPAFTEATDCFPPAMKPVYLSRLAVQPAWLRRGSLAGAQCLRRAIDVATSAGADVLRSEANPDLTAVRELLSRFGFEEFGHAADETGRRRVYLQRCLVQTLL